MANHSSKQLIWRAYSGAGAPIGSGTVAPFLTTQVFVAGAASYKLSVAANGAPVGSYRSGLLVEITNAP